MTDLKTAMATARILKESRDFLSEEHRWIKNRLFEAGNDDHPELAVQACALGAVSKTALVTPYQIREKTSAWEAVHKLAASTGSKMPVGLNPVETFAYWVSNITSFNDFHKTTHADVLAAFDLALEDACAEVRRLAKANGQSV